MVDGCLAWSAARKQRTLSEERVNPNIEVLGLFGELWREAAREPCGAPEGADRKLSQLIFLIREQKQDTTASAATHA